MSVTIRPVAPDDRTEWEVLYHGYAEFYGVTQTHNMRARVWGWLHDPDHETEGFVAVGDDGTLLGLAHFRAFARPLAAATGGFLDDMFVNPDARGARIGDALIDALKAEAGNRGWSVLRWITAEDNARARRLYDRIATQTKWVTYDIPL